MRPFKNPLSISVICLYIVDFKMDGALSLIYSTRILDNA